ncbi:unnamed protein product [Hymenolepis diminuta]|uniref:Uncharacterized protein n=1 Tax=Hymenolepis diminuta TaxID=6216 RepID=A0A564YBT5_HYMDI|nr:unnamed protein product [Hymenolepis diminuta]
MVNEHVREIRDHGFEAPTVHILNFQPLVKSGKIQVSHQGGRITKFEFWNTSYSFHKCYTTRFPKRSKMK